MIGAITFFNAEHAQDPIYRADGYIIHAASGGVALMRSRLRIIT